MKYMDDVRNRIREGLRLDVQFYPCAYGSVDMRVYNSHGLLVSELEELEPVEASSVLYGIAVAGQSLGLMEIPNYEGEEDE